MKMKRLTIKREFFIRALTFVMMFSMLLPNIVPTGAAVANCGITEEEITKIVNDFNAHGWVLKQGFWANYSSTGRRAIRGVQKLLCVVGYETEIDESVGPHMSSRIYDFQKANGLTPDRIVGRQTFNALVAAAHAQIKNESVGNATHSSGYNVGSILNLASKDLGKTRAQLGYKVDYCTLWLTSVIRSSGVSLKSAANPRDLVVYALNSGLGTYYSFRSTNTTNLKQNGLKRTDLVVNSSRNKVTPQPGDIVVYLWNEDVGRYNWSHCGFVKSFSQNTIKTIEGNTSGGIVAERNRPYDSTVVGILRLD